MQLDSKAWGELPVVGLKGPWGLKVCTEWVGGMGGGGAR